MKILSAEQVYQADKSTIEKEGISSDQLMERAALRLFEWIHGRLQGAPVKISLCCGIGNNGGDGLALARHLWEHGYHIEVFIVNYSDKRSPDFLTNLDRLKDRKIWPKYLDQESPMPDFTGVEMIIDALFGIGLNRAPDPWVGKIINAINASDTFVLSIDVPSGMFVDRPMEADQQVIHATTLLTFQVPKLAFFMPETGKFVDHWEVLDIGLDPDFLKQAEATYELTEMKQARSWCANRSRFSHKGDYGHALILGGSYGKIGAVILASRAALQTGCGLLTAYIPKCGYVPVQTSIPEAMVLTDQEEDKISGITLSWKPSAVGAGIGLGRSPVTAKALHAFLKEQKLPLVLDADALNILSENQDMLKDLPPKSILTPHPGELARLIGPWQDDFEKLDKALDFSTRYDCVLLIKGAYSLVLYEGKGYVNPTGNPGMATAGSGDVLTGIITSLLSQKYDALTAARFGVFLHGMAGDLAARELGEEAVIASSISNYLSDAFQLLNQNEGHTDTGSESESGQGK
ncbi:MAG: NAD(P)H-hydrate dehydratase [Eudoraea sp.]|nr:NAD(P)H-hydrate dehydratase [Eudoraea sp.]NNJ41654.1 NAD(P)H-hydrate dehydratase [Eudoraea sp.]